MFFFLKDDVSHYLITAGALRDDSEAVVIGRRVAEDVHDGSHLLYPVQAGDRRTHHLSGRDTVNRVPFADK